MSTLCLRIPESLHRALRELAEREGISINQLITSAIGEKLAVLMAEEYLEARAARGRRNLYDQVLARVPLGEPIEGDRVADAPRARRKSPARKRAGTSSRKPRL